MTTEEILVALAYHDGNFPRHALEKALARPEDIVEPLLEVLDRAAQEPGEISSPATYMAHIYAIFLLAELREQRAYPKIVALFEQPVDLSEELTREVTSEWLGRIFASVGHGELAPLVGLVERNMVDVDVRCAALRGMVAMVACEEASREDVMTLFRELYRGRLERRASHVWDVLVSCSAALSPFEVYEEIERAYEEKLLDAYFIEPAEVDEALGLGRLAALAKLRETGGKKEYRLISNAIAEMEWWACFQDPAAREAAG